jgi:hypothetical protein
VNEFFKRPDLAEQELYAMLIMYNLIRSLIYEAASKHDKNPLLIGFLDSLQLIIDAAPFMSNTQRYQRNMFDYLLELIADSPIDRPRRPRVNPRVIKVKMSKYKRKRSADKSTYRNFEEDLIIITRKAA